MTRVQKYYIVENEAGEPCSGRFGLLHDRKKDADTTRREFGRNYTVETFVRERPLPKRATGDAAARATDRLIGKSITKTFKSIEKRAKRVRSHVSRAVNSKNAGKPPAPRGS